MTASVEPLPWDSEFFGVPIGRVDLDGVDAPTLARIDEEARDLGISCLYGTLHDPAKGHTALLVQHHGHELVEVSLRFGRPARPFEVPPTRSRVRRGTLDDLPLLQDALDVLAPWSRFGADPRFGPAAARRMHEAWVTRAAAEPDQRLLAIAEDDEGVTGLSTNVWSPVPRVDLMGVTKPGTGASQALMNALIEWAGEGETEAGPCAARNIAVLRYVEGCGFSVVETNYLYHRWYDETARVLR